jgi:GNAT superfamily N-acetyltransferase
MKCRIATADDCPMLAEWNHQLIRDEGHRNPMTVEELEERMRGWLNSGEYPTGTMYRAVVFEDKNEAVAYALFRETEAEIYLRQFFVVRHRRREGIGRQAIQRLFNNLWPQDKRWTVSVLTNNLPALAFWRAMGYEDYVLSLEIMPENQPTRRPAD